MGPQHDVEDVAVDCVAEVAATLMRDFGRALPASVVTHVVLQARRDLAGQVLDGAFPEMLQRLSHIRLTQLQLELTA